MWSWLGECDEYSFGIDLTCPVGVILFWIFIFCNALLFIVCVAFFVHSFFFELEWRITKVIKLLLPIIPLMAFLNMSLMGPDYYFAGGSYGLDQHISQIISGGLRGYVFLSIYSLLVIFWIIVYSMAHRRSSDLIVLVKRVAVVLNLVMYTIWIILIILILRYNETAHIVEACYAATLDFLAFLAFVVVGFRLHFQLRSTAVVSESSMRIARKVGVLTVICSIDFLLRSIFLFLLIFVIDSNLGKLITTFLYNLICETLPTILILIIFSSDTQLNSSQRMSSSDYETVEYSYEESLIVNPVK
jgi:hypothetical protein